MGMRTKDQEKTWTSKDKLREEYDFYVNRHNAWKANQVKINPRNQMASGRLLEVIEALDPKMKLETEENHNIGVSVLDAYAALEKCTKVRFYLINHLVRLPLYFLLYFIFMHRVAAITASLSCMQVYTFDRDLADVATWDNELAEAVVIKLCAKANIPLPRQLAGMSINDTTREDATAELSQPGQASPFSTSRLQHDCT
jgi:hypothetical protein